jgi:glutaredoxin
MDSSATGRDDSHEQATAQAIIYTSSDCRWCGPTKEHLTKRGVSYIEKNVELDEAAAMEAFSYAGRRQTPVVVIGSQVVVGYQRGEIDAILGVATTGSAEEGVST